MSNDRHDCCVVLARGGSLRRGLGEGTGSGRQKRGGTHGRRVAGVDSQERAATGGGGGDVEVEATVKITGRVVVEV